MPKNPKNKFHWFYNMKLSNKIALMYGGVFAVLILAASTFILFFSLRQYTALCRSELMETAKIIENHITSGGEISYDAISDIIPSPYITAEITEISPKNNMPPIPHFPSLPPEDRDRGFKSVMSHNFMVEHNHRRYSVELRRSHMREGEIMYTILFLFILANILGIVGAYFVGRYISKSMLRPIVSMTHTAERISIEDLSRRIQYEGPDDELKLLAESFNEMIQRLEKSFQKQTQFISDASHELRTPVSVIQGYANLIGRWGKDDPTVLEESIDSIKTETEHMSMLIKKLLFLAKQDNTQAIVQKSLLDLNHIANEIAKESAIMAQCPPIQINEKAPCYILGDYDLIKQCIWIFVENAIRYSAADIQITLFQKEDKACVAIQDHGIGISEEDVPYIFDRFYRADKSRSKEVPGTGLGLSIAKRILNTHKGTVEVESVLGEGTTFTLLFPFQDPSET